MKTRCFRFVLGWLVIPLFASAAVAAEAKPEAGPPAFREGYLLVKPKGGGSAAALDGDHAAIGARPLRVFRELGNLQWVNLPPGLPVAVALEHYRSRGNVAFAEPDYRVSAVAQVFPGDPDFGSFWGLHNSGQTGGIPDADIDAPEAWSIRWDAGTVVVGVIDTGLDYHHPDLAENVWVNSGEIPGNGVDDDSNGYVDDVHGINAINATGDPADDHYHGTHVAGTIGARGGNGIGGAGVAWRVQLMGLKFLDSNGSGFVSDAIECIQYAVNQGVAVLNNSWGGGGYSQALYDAIAAARAAGIVFVAAAGNAAGDNDVTPFYPAGYLLDNVVAVAATDSADARAGFSNYGAGTVGLGAPGVGIQSTVPNGGYSSLNGTSMASPHVAGAVALLRAAFPDATPQALIHRLLATVDTVSGLQSTTISGGRLNLYQALATPPPLRPIALLNASPAGGEPPLTVQFTDRSSGEVSSRSLNFGDGSAASSTTSGTHLYQNPGVYEATLVVEGPGGSSTKSQKIVVGYNYTAVADTYAWIDSAGMTTLTLGDDAVTGSIPLPFVFPFFDAPFSNVYVSSNGKLLLGGNAGGTAYGNSDIPTAVAPNNAIYAYWDDLNPSAGGSIRYGVTAGGAFLVSWEGVPHYQDPLKLFSFQALLFPDGNLKLQFREVNPADTVLGGGRSATVGVEDASGYIGRSYVFNGSRLLGNLEAVRFSPGGGGSIGQPPAAPSNLSAVPACDTSPSLGAIQLTWQDNASNETGFEVWHSGDQGSTWSQLSPFSPVTGTSFKHVGLVSGTFHVYQVRAINASGQSAFTSPVGASTYAQPTIPSGLTASASSASQIQVSWADVADESGYRLERMVEGGTWTQIAAPPAGASSYSDGGLAAGVNYSYRIRAAGWCNYLSGYSATASARTPAQPPAAPSGLTARTVSKSQISLSWKDNANNESGFQVEVSADGLVWGSPVLLGPNSTSYSSSGLAAGRTYYFRVRAYNEVGYSAYAGPVSARTKR